MTRWERLQRIGDRLRRLSEMESERRDAFHDAVLAGQDVKRPWCASIRYLLKYQTWIDYTLRDLVKRKP